jgi:hypothetical protein
MRICRDYAARETTQTIFLINMATKYKQANFMPNSAEEVVRRFCPASRSDVRQAAGQEVQSALERVMPGAAANSPIVILYFMDPARPDTFVDYTAAANTPGLLDVILRNADR